MKTKTIFNDIFTKILINLDIKSQEISSDTINTNKINELRSRKIPTSPEIAEMQNTYPGIFLKSIHEPKYFLDFANSLFEDLSKANDELNLLCSSQKLGGSKLETQRNLFVNIENKLKQINKMNNVSSENLAVIMTDILLNAYYIADIEKKLTQYSGKRIIEVALEQSSLLNSLSTGSDSSFQQSIENSFASAASLDSNKISDEVKLRKGLRLGYLLEKTNNNWGNKKEKSEGIKEIKFILESESEYIPQVNEDTYSSLEKSVIDNFKQKDIVFYSSIIMGKCLGMTSSKFCNFNGETKDRELNDDGAVDLDKTLEEIPACVIDNKKELVDLILETSHSSMPIRYECVVQHLIPYNNLFAIAKHEREVAKLLQDYCRTLMDAQKTLSLWVSESILMHNKKSYDILSTFQSKLQQMSKKEYKLRRKYRVWPSVSLWIFQDDFEEICMDHIESITKNASSRKKAIKLAQTSLKMSKEFDNDRIIQVYERVVFEFCLASNKEFAQLKRLLN